MRVKPKVTPPLNRMSEKYRTEYRKMPQFNFKVSDLDVIDYLNAQSNKSKTIVTALKEKKVNDLQEKLPQTKKVKAIITGVTI